MPHLVLEASKELQSKIRENGILQKLHDQLAETGVTEKNRIKSRIVLVEDLLVGEWENGRLVHLTLSILEGRPATMLQEVGQQLFSILQAQGFGKQTSVTVEIREMSLTKYFRS